jgi:hypothetical protein
LAHAVDFVTLSLHASETLSGIMIALLVATLEAIGFGKDAAAFRKYIAWISAFLDWTDCPHHAGYRSLD